MPQLIDSVLETVGQPNTRKPRNTLTPETQARIFALDPDEHNITSANIGGPNQHNQPKQPAQPAQPTQKEHKLLLPPEYFHVWNVYFMLSEEFDFDEPISYQQLIKALGKVVTRTQTAQETIYQIQRTPEFPNAIPKLSTKTHVSSRADVLNVYAYTIPYMILKSLTEPYKNQDKLNQYFEQLKQQEFPPNLVLNIYLDVVEKLLKYYKLPLKLDDTQTPTDAPTEHTTKTSSKSQPNRRIKNHNVSNDRTIQAAIEQALIQFLGIQTETQSATQEINDIQFLRQVLRQETINNLDFLELAKAIKQIIEKLPEEQKKVVSIYFYENKPLQTIANELGITVTRTRQLLSRGINNIMNKLQLKKQNNQ